MWFLKLSPLFHNRYFKVESRLDDIENYFRLIHRVDICCFWWCMVVTYSLYHHQKRVRSDSDCRDRSSGTSAQGAYCGTERGGRAFSCLTLSGSKLKWFLPFYTRGWYDDNHIAMSLRLLSVSMRYLAVVERLVAWLYLEANLNDLYPYIREVDMMSWVSDYYQNKWDTFSRLSWNLWKA